ncbi:MAG: hypothetical protein GX616_18040 [Planctomycetes bacterium]|nr:hypothetical protein [Planctomycetota bacterium]
MRSTTYQASGAPNQLDLPGHVVRSCISMNHAILADGIDLPIIVAFGLVTFGPLTLGVSLIESIVFRLVLNVTIRQTYWRILLANTVSTLAGGLVFMFQDVILHAASIRSSIPAFVMGYRWVALILIAIYYVKSVLVEGLVVARTEYAIRLKRPRGRLFRTLALANAASYLVTGPLFYYSTRPTFGNLSLDTTTAWSANRDMPVYFVDTKDHFIKLIGAGGGDPVTIVPYPGTDFLVADDGEAFVYRGVDKSLYVLRRGDAEPVCAWATTQPFFMQSVSLSPDHRRLAYARAAEGERYPDRYDSLVIVDLDSGQAEAVPFSAKSWCPIVAWSRDGTQILASTDEDDIAVLSGEPPWSVTTTRPRSSVASDELVTTHGRYGDRCGYGGGIPRVWLDKDEKGQYHVQAYPHLGAHLRVSRNDQVLIRASNDYGLLKLGLPSPSCPTFLPNGTEMLLEWWGQLYLLDVEARRMGLLADGRNYVLLTPRFRVAFSTSASG